MDTYGSVLKNLIRFSNIKMVTIANSVGYDVSYISKWANQSKLPTARNINHVNKVIANLVSQDVLNEDELDAFNVNFQQMATEETLEETIFSMLKVAYDETLAQSTKKDLPYQAGEILTKSYTDQEHIVNQIINVFTEIWESKEPVEILCSLDIFALLDFLHGKIPDLAAESPNADIRVTTGFNASFLDKKDYLKLYCIINKYNMVSFDFYNNETFRNGNVIVIKNKVAITCSMNQLGEIYILSVITAPDAVNSIYSKTKSLFRKQDAVIKSVESEKLFDKG